MSDERNEQDKSQDGIESTDELTDEELEQVAGGESFLEELVRAWGEALDKQAKEINP